MSILKPGDTVPLADNEKFLLLRRLATHRHKRSGKLYTVLARGSWEPTRENCVVYRALNGRIWVRPELVFEDGRFVPVRRCQLLRRYRRNKQWNIHKRIRDGALLRK
jgi:hypothetical protein